MPTASPQAQAIAELDALRPVLLDEEGEEIVEEAFPYDEYLASLPPREERRRFATPVSYWEPRWPGCTLQPYPRLGAFSSERSGAWVCEYPWQERAVRSHILSNLHVDPDTLKVSDDELAVMAGTAKGNIRYCHGGGCAFASCSLLAVDLHERFHSGHVTKNAPKKD